MKKLFILPLLLFVLAACRQNGNSGSTETALSTFDSADAPVFSFEKETYDFGQITEGEKVVYDFKFTNTGKSPLIIGNATATCGCTAPEYPKEPIAPGAGGTIHVVFNSAGKSGMQDKVITLSANTASGTYQLHLMGDVKPKNK